MMAALPFPCTIFKSQRGMDDYSASDMRCGDLSGAQLKTHYRLHYISDRVDPSDPAFPDGSPSIDVLL